MTEEAAKRAFALALMERPSKPFEVAFAIWPSNEETNKALYAATYWPTDPQVLEFQREIISAPEVAGILPTKYQAAREVLERARKCRDDEVFAKLMSLYCTIMGQIDKPGSNAVVNAPTFINKVIMMPQTQAKEEWSLRATAHQRNLVLEGEAISARK